MLLRENRLIESKDFDSVHRAGRFFSHGRLIVKIRENGLNKTRIGIMVGVKFSSRAVDRNKVKRWIREISKKRIKNIKPGFDMVFMLKKAEKFPLHAELERDLEVILEKSRLSIK